MTVAGGRTVELHIVGVHSCSSRAITLLPDNRHLWITSTFSLYDSADESR